MKCGEFLLPAWVAARVSLMMDDKEKEIIRMKLGIESEGKRIESFALLVVLLMLPLASAISDLSVYSDAKFSSQDEAPILVEWFHGAGDESQVEDLKEMDRDGEITLLHWRTGSDNDGGNLPSDDANARHMYHSFVTTPAVAVDGFPENTSYIQPKIRQNEVSIDWTIN